MLNKVIQTGNVHVRAGEGDSTWCICNTQVLGEVWRPVALEVYWTTARADRRTRQSQNKIEREIRKTTGRREVKERVKGQNKSKRPVYTRYKASNVHTFKSLQDFTVFVSLSSLYSIICVCRISLWSSLILRVRGMGRWDICCWGGIITRSNMMQQYKFS